MNRHYFAILAILPMLGMAGCGKGAPATLDLAMPAKYEGKVLEFITLEDSVTLASAKVRDGKAHISIPDSVRMPVMTFLTVDGRIRGLYVAEKGEAVFSDSSSVAEGTPLNDRLRHMMQRLDSVEDLNDMQAYTLLCEKMYNDTKGTPLANYFGLEYIKYAEPAQVDSILENGGTGLKDMKRAGKYITYSRLRKATSPGQYFTDIPGRNGDGSASSLSGLVKPGKYVIVDFWASWCPYCIKDIPALKDLYAEMHEDGNVDIVGVAVRDTPEDTREAVRRHGIEWDVLYDTGTVPYDIYGFSGIPHLMLIGPDGKIIARGESVEQTKQRLLSLLR